MGRSNSRAPLSTAECDCESTKPKPSANGSTLQPTRESYLRAAVGLLIESGFVVSLKFLWIMLT